MRAQLLVLSKTSVLPEIANYQIPEELKRRGCGCCAGAKRIIRRKKSRLIFISMPPNHKKLQTRLIPRKPLPHSVCKFITGAAGTQLLQHSSVSSNHPRASCLHKACCPAVWSRNPHRHSASASSLGPNGSPFQRAQAPSETYNIPTTLEIKLFDAQPSQMSPASSMIHEVSQ